LHEGFRKWSGTPTAVSEFRHDDSSDDVPAELDVLYFQPLLEEASSGEELFTVLATAGMSTRIMRGLCPRAELILDIRGGYDWDDLYALGEKLAELAVAPFYGGPSYLPDQVLRNVSLPLFSSMDCILVTEWGVHPPPEWLPGVTPPVQLLSIQPLYAAEADIIEEIGASDAYRRFRAEDIDWDDPNRAQASLQGIPSTLLRPNTLLTTADVKGELFMAGDAIAQTIKDTWRDIEEWYRQHAPRLLEDLATGASDAEISDLEGRLGLTLPDDYKASLRIHNGDLNVHAYHYMTIDSVAGTWAMMTDLSNSGAFKGRPIDQDGGGIIRNTWWDRGWVPFLEDSGGNLFCIDTAPAAEGIAGQILQMEMGSGPFPTSYRSFQSWLQDYRNSLYQDKFEVDADGFLREV